MIQGSKELRATGKEILAMVEREFTIVNRLGLHARAAAKLVHLAGKFKCRIYLCKDGEEVDAKSILGILLLAAAQHSKISLRCEGGDESAAMRDLSDLIANGFEETS